MAALVQYVHFKDTPPVDGLCPRCFNPSLQRFILQRVTLDGITNMGERIACTDCRIWQGPIEEYK